MEKNINKLYKKMNLRIFILNFNLAMNYIIHKILVLIKRHLNYLEDNIFKFFCKKYNRLLLFKKLFFFPTYNNEKPKT